MAGASRLRWLPCARVRSIGGEQPIRVAHADEGRRSHTVELADLVVERDDRRKADAAADQHRPARRVEREAVAERSGDQQLVAGRAWPTAARCPGRPPRSGSQAAGRPARPRRGRTKARAAGTGGRRRPRPSRSPSAACRTGRPAGAGRRRLRPERPVGTVMLDDAHGRRAPSERRLDALLADAGGHSRRGADHAGAPWALPADSPCSSCSERTVGVIRCASRRSPGRRRWRRSSS